MSITPSTLRPPAAAPTAVSPTPQIIYIMPQPAPNNPPKKKVSLAIPATVGGILLGGIPIGRLALVTRINPSIWKNEFARGAMQIATVRAVVATTVGALAGGAIAYAYNKIRGRK